MTPSPLSIAASLAALLVLAAPARADGPPMSSDPAAMVKALASDDDATSSAAYDAIVKAGPKAIPGLLAASKGLADELLSQLGSAIAEMGEPAAKPLIAAGLMSESDDPRVVAMAALIELDDEAVPALIHVLRAGSEEARSRVALVLSKMDELDVDAVGEVLKDGSEAAKGTAAAILVQFGDTGAETLVDLLVEESCRGICIRALKEIGKAAIPPLVKGLEATDEKAQDAAVDALVAIGEESIEPLIATTHHPRVDVRGSAAAALGNLKDERAVPALLPLLDDPDASVKADAETALESVSGARFATRAGWETWWATRPGGAKK